MLFEILAVGALSLLTSLGVVTFSIYLQLRPLMNLVKYMCPKVFWYHETPERVLALTIDDAPSEHTHAILDLLDEFECKATFFIIESQAKSKMKKTTVLSNINVKLSRIS